MRRRPPRSTRIDTRFAYRALFRSSGRGTAIRAVTARRGDRFGQDRMLFRANGRGDPHGSASAGAARSEEHTSELQSLMRNSYAVFCLQKTNTTVLNLVAIHDQQTTIKHTPKYPLSDILFAAP